MDKKDLILGKNALKEAIAAGTEIQKIFLSETLERSELGALLKLARSRKIPVVEVPKAKLDRISKLQHQGVIGLTTPVDFRDLGNLVDGLFFNGVSPALAVCDGITDVRNFGAIARSAEIFGIHGIVIGQKNSAPINGESIKASAGALLRLPVCREKSLLHSLKQLKSSGVVILCANEKAKQEIRQTDLKRPLALVLGAEGMGVSMEILQIADESVRIPQIGEIESLNVSVAAGILFYEWMLQNRP